MKIQAGVGNSITSVLDASEFTLAISGLSIADIDGSNVQVYNTTRSAYMLGGDSTATATVERTLSSGLTVQTLTLSALPALTADADTLVIFIDLPDAVAQYIVSAQIAVNTTPV